MTKWSQGDWRIRVMILIIVLFFSQAVVSCGEDLTPTSSSESFIYQIQVQDLETGEIVKNASVYILVGGNRAAADDVTDDRGTALISIDASRAGRIAKLVVEAHGYEKHTLSVTLTRDALPKVVQIKPKGIPIVSPPTPTRTATVPAPSATGRPTSVPEPTATQTATPTLTPEPTVSDADTSEVPPTPTFGVGSPATALRNAHIFPTNDSDVPPLTLVRQGDTVTVLAHYFSWLKVRTADGVEGWVYQPGWFEITGEVEVLPTAIPPQFATSTATALPCETGALEFDFYHDPGTEQCVPGRGWSVNIHYIVRGGTCEYTYYWEGEQIYGPTTENELIYTVYWGDAALSGTGRVESGGQTVQHGLFVPKPDCQ